MYLKQIANDDLAQYAYLVGCKKTGEAHKEIPEKPLVVHCQSGLRAAAVATFLARQGRTDIQCALGAIRSSKPIHSLAGS